MQIYNRYIFRTTFIATVSITMILVAVTMLTQSLRFLELIVESGASTWSFWILTFLNLPRFFEIIVPIGLATSVIFILNRMTVDSELSVLKATGFSHWALARPLLIIALGFSIFLLAITTWIGPLSTAKTNLLRHTLKSEFSGLLFKDGVFNEVDDGLTFYIRELDSSGELHGIIIHDERIKDEPAKTIYAKRGVLAQTETGNAILVFDGARQDFNAKKQQLQRLSFERYSIDLPEEEEETSQRSKKPKEYNLSELLNPDPALNFDEKQLREIRVEAHLRILAPFLALGYVFIATASLLCGTINRRGQGAKIITAIALIILLQSLYIALSDMAVTSTLALGLCYALVILPIAIGYFILRPSNKARIQEYK